MPGNKLIQITPEDNFLTLVEKFRTLCGPNQSKILSFYFEKGSIQFFESSDSEVDDYDDWTDDGNDMIRGSIYKIEINFD